MKIYTKTGDNGETGLFGGQRVPKSSLRVETYGTIDELNSFLGLTLAENPSSETEEILTWLQNRLFDAGSDLATPYGKTNTEKSIQCLVTEPIIRCETEIDRISDGLPELTNFILPGGVKCAALLHTARTVCRRAERLVTALKSTEQINENILIFLNRISDLLFVLARHENKQKGKSDIPWQKV